MYMGNEYADGSIKTSLKDSLITERYTSESFSVPAYSTGGQTIDITKSGYTALGVVGLWARKNANTLYYNFRLGNSTDGTPNTVVTVGVKNHGNAAIDGQFTVDILYVKNQSDLLVNDDSDSYEVLASIRKIDNTAFTEYELEDDVTNYKYLYIATYGNGAPSSSTQSWGGTLIPVNMLLDKVFGDFVISYQSAYYIEVGLGADTRHISAKASDQYTRGLTIYGIKSDWLTGTNKSNSKELLYINSSPTNPMTGNITLVTAGANEYAYLEVIYKTAHVYNGYQSVSSQYIEGGHITLNAPTGSTGEFSGTVMNAVRTITMSNGKLTADAAVTMGTGGVATNDNMCIPYKIYGIKTSVEYVEQVSILSKTVTKSVSLAAGKNSVTIDIGLPNTATIMSISLSQVPNANWVSAAINSWSASAVVVAYNNTYSGTISGNFQLMIVYKDSAVLSNSIINKYSGDGSWKNGDTTTSAPIKYRLRNGVCYMTAEYAGQFTIDNTLRTIMTLPEGYRPSTQIVAPVVNRATPGDGVVYINSDGTVALRDTFQATSYFDFYVAFPVD